ncbi:S-adenosyl-L-methionine-dependent methyltransferase [Biscogniauxia marginata]|nr:S-adenosyl-L-methionine-dependent methyltransferase [Biscogniauxia marginata]
MTTWDEPKETQGDGWSQGSVSYEKYLVPVTRKGAEALIEEMIKMNPITSESNILDCGTGPGLVPIILRQLYPSVPITAVDIAPGMIERIKRLDLPGVKLGLSDATNLDRAVVPKDAFTHAIGALMIQFCGDKQPSVVHEFYDSLVPGGVAGHLLTTGITIADPWHRACERLDPAYQRVYVHDDKAWKSFEPLEAAYRDVGFEDIRKVKLWMPMSTIQSKEDYIDFWFRGHHPAFEKRDMAAWKGDPEEVIPELLKVLGEYKDLSSELGAYAEIVLGRKPKLGS